MTGIYPLTGTLQHYVWGGEDYLPRLLHLNKQPHTQYAEWWLGAHISSPSTIKVDGKLQSLTEFLTQNPTALGEQNRAVFGDELPYLLKILDVKKPLSIQLHPTKQQAEAGFAEENARGVPLTDPQRTYKDSNHKPEMMIALSDFWLLHGFKTKAKILAALKTQPSLTALADKLANQSLHDFYADIMRAPQSELAAWLLPVLDANQAAYREDKLDLHQPEYWICYVTESMAIARDKLDAGLMCFYLFNIVHLQTGEGIFQDAGLPHAYLRGQNIELMACSDNVIRGGLTPKHVDISELLKIVDCREVEPEIIPAAPQHTGSFTYQTPARDFALENVRFDSGFSVNGTAQNGTILCVMEGVLRLTENTTTLELKQGESAFICAQTGYRITGIENGYCVLAKLPS
ncbi:mannose-6-phosphate isomerase, class I [Actinobacillus succinogenes]|uniref:mannose-6-phosphate isomerase n=1 Tax=Actinobacillus succinogenes (strain ATCC 55618 / DSM 22257 / CCUG 43843 / 130Z) TaxID=339671 RepID=A6VMV5_ACTSZ|nr:mannose-6-phosphate isomerase, class I [Actinobacillus succinogenes]ABR74302.1 mannose-6-phosphate isomerase, class I [Actinobacillus succinogenes 130Z]PHI39273.1 mannose-6-phosphate isomerase, class I [Actinobacillus succinogenes]